MTRHTVVSIPGDGIGKETVPEGIRVLDAAARRFGLDVHYDHFDFASCDYFAKHGAMMPEDWKERIGGHDAIFYGAVGWPATVPDHVSLWGSLLKFRREFDQYVSLRPARLMAGVPCPLAGRKQGDIDFVIVRENTEDLYAGLEHVVVPGVVESLKIITEKASTRVAKFAFEYARSHGRKRVTAVHKANIMKLSDGLFLECVRRVHRDHPEIELREMIIDNCAMQLVTKPEQFDVLVMDNLYGDILSDLGADLIGGLGVAAGSNIGDQCAVFEAVHGSAPDLAGRGLANPIAVVRSAAMMLDHVGESDRAGRIRDAVAAMVREGTVRTYDMMKLSGGADVIARGAAATTRVTDAILEHLG